MTKHSHPLAHVVSPARFAMASAISKVVVGVTLGAMSFLPVKICDASGMPGGIGAAESALGLLMGIGPIGIAPLTPAIDSPASPDDGIIFMPILAMGFPSVLSKNGNASQDIFSRSNRFQMFWIDTFWVSAQMVNMKSIGNLSFVQFVREPVCAVVFPFDFHLEIPTTLPSMKDPARFCLLYPDPEFLLWSKRPSNEFRLLHMDLLLSRKHYNRRII